MGKVPGESSSNKIINQDKQEVAPLKQNMRAACPNNKLAWNSSCFRALVYALDYVVSKDMSQSQCFKTE